MMLHPMGMQEPKPKFEYRDRSQIRLGPVDLEALIAADHPARAIWELLESMDFSAYESTVVTREGQAGRSATPPRLLAAIWIYGYSCGVGSARALERMQAHEPGLRWLCADDVVNHHTLSDFRSRDSQALDALFVQVLAAMEQAQLVDLRTVAHDGTKIRAASGRGSYHRKKTLKESLKQARAVVRRMKDLAEEPAGGEEGEDKRRQAAQKRAASERVERMKRSLKELGARERRMSGKQDKEELRVSGSEPEARRMKMADASFGPAYNVQISTESKSTLIVAIEAVQDVNDTQQLAPAIRRIKKQTGARRFNLLADGGYATRENVEYAASKRVTLYAPWKQDEARHKGALKRNGIAPDYGPPAFAGETGGEALICPEGKRLVKRATAKRHGHLKVIYQAEEGSCEGCAKRAACCGHEGKGGPKRIERVVESEEMKQYQARMESEEGRQAYKERSRLGEYAQMQLKAVRGLTRFRLKGLKKVRQEVKLWAIAYNIAQWIRLSWKKAANLVRQPAMAV